MAVSRIHLESSKSALSAVIARLGSSGVVKIFSGALGSTLDADPSGLLVTIPLNSTPFNTVGDADPGASATVNTTGTLDAAADGAGTAQSYVAEDGSGNNVIGGDVSGPAGDGIMKINNTSIEVGQTVTVTGWTLTMPEF